MVAVREPSSSRLDALLEDQADRPFSYAEVGATRDALPKGYHHVRRSVPLGYGTAVFDRAVDGLRGWQAHRLAGVNVHPTDARLDEGTTVGLVVPFAFGWVTAACRVVYLSAEPSRFAFAYGTLPHHSVKGEEAFVVARDDVGRVQFEIIAFLRPRRVLMRPAAPVVYRMDKRLVRGYLQGLQDYIAEHP